MSDATTTFSWDILPPSIRQTPGQVLCGRYELGASLALGGHGQVFAANDRLGSAEIVVKMEPVRSQSALNRVRRELTALRMLRLPGVVTLLDDGVVQGQHFIVMERVHGDCFPVHGEWDSVLPLFLDLLETLRAMHASGIVHRDLKPANILVVNGRIRLIDFGLARIQREGLVVEGTPHYMAPEQITGAHQDHRTDLYSVGVMLYENLCGLRPHRGSTKQITSARPQHPVQPLRQMQPNVNPGLAALVDELLSIAPDRRPSCAEEVTRRLGGDSLTRTVQQFTQDLPERCEPRDLMQLFSGPELFFHLQTDASTALHAATDGVRPKVAKRLERWIRGGYCHLDGHAVVMDRMQLERLALPAPRADQDMERTLSTLCDQTKGYLETGHSARAYGGAVLLLSVTRQQNPAGEQLALELLCETALGMHTALAIDQALGQVGQSEERGLAVHPLRLLLRGVLFARRGERARALECLDALTELEREGLEIWRVGARVQATKRDPELPGLLTELQDWASGPERQAVLLGWWGHHHYERGDYKAALQSHLASLPLRCTPRGRSIALANAAGAATDANDPAAPALIQRLLAQAISLRRPDTELRAQCMLRSWAQQQGETLALWPEAVQAAERISPGHALSFAVTDLVTVWQTRPACAQHIAQQTIQLCAQSGFQDGVVVCRAALHDLGVPQEGILDAAMEIQLDNLRLEALAILAPHFPEVDLLQIVQGLIHRNKFVLDLHLTFMTPREALRRCTEQ